MSTRKPTPSRRSLPAHGREPGNPPVAFVAFDPCLGQRFRHRHQGRQVDPHAVRPGHAECGGSERQRLHEGEPGHTPGHQHDHRFGDGHLAEPAGGQGDLGPANSDGRVFFQQLNDRQYGGLRATRSESGAAQDHRRPRTASRRLTCPTSGWAIPTRPSPRKFELPLGRRTSGHALQARGRHQRAGRDQHAPLRRRRHDFHAPPAERR